jgi:hypothetical protein
MNYKEFKDYIENMVPYETIYEDGEGRMILVITMLAAFTAMNRKWVGLKAEEIHNTKGYEETREMYDFARAIEAKLKDRNQ